MTCDVRIRENAVDGFATSSLLGSGAVTIHWHDAAGESGYKLLTIAPDGTQTTINLPADTSSYRITGLDTAAHYQFKLWAWTLDAVSPTTPTLNAAAAAAAVGLRKSQRPGDRHNLSRLGRRLHHGVPSRLPHTGNSAEITFTAAGLPSGATWLPQFDIGIDSPEISVGSALLTVGDTEGEEVAVSASDHYGHAWPGELNLSPEVEGDAVSAEGNVTIGAGIGVGSLLLKGVEVGISTVVLIDSVTQVKSAPATQQAAKTKVVVPDEITLVVGGSIQTIPTVFDPGRDVSASNRELQATSDDKVDLSGNGKLNTSGENGETQVLTITGKAVGTSFVTVTDKKSREHGTIKVNVLPAALESVTPSKPRIAAGTGSCNVRAKIAGGVSDVKLTYVLSMPGKEAVSFPVTSGQSGIGIHEIQWDTPGLLTVTVTIDGTNVSQSCTITIE